MLTTCHPIGKSSLPESCPVCAHSPISATDCKPNKSLRLTVKAFLKSEEKKRDKERATSTVSAPATPVTPAVPGSAETPSAKEGSIDSKELHQEGSTIAGASEFEQKDENQQAAEPNNQSVCRWLLCFIELQLTFA